MQRLSITSVHDGVIEWTAHGAHTFSVEVDGAAVSDGADGLLRASFLDTNRFPKKPLSVTVCDIRDERTAVSFIVSADRKTLSMPPVKVGVKSGVLHWDEVKGACGYKIIDVRQNVMRTARNWYDMNYRTVVYGVVAVSSSKYICDGEVSPIKYLDGEGTESSPFTIKTPFELRAIDYYEQLYAEKARAQNFYVIDKDIDYRSVAALEGESNLFTLSRPFYGVLDGRRHVLCNISVGYDGGYWALFDFIARGAAVKNIVFRDVQITNRLQSVYNPLDCSIATVAHINYGEISSISVKNAKYLAAGGAVCGICSHNGGRVYGCTVSGELAQGLLGLVGQACYEMSGIVTENRAGGVVKNNAVLRLTVRGSLAENACGAHYPNVRTVAGIVAVNRAGGRVEDNIIGKIELVTVEPSSCEYGGICAYNAGAVAVGDMENLGTLTVNGEPITCAVGKNGESTGDICSED